MEIPLISKRQFNRFRKFLPVHGNAEKINGSIVIRCAIWVKKMGAPGRKYLKDMENLIHLGGASAAGASWIASGASFTALLKKHQKEAAQ